MVMNSLTLKLIQYAVEHLKLSKDDALFWHHFIAQELDEVADVELEDVVGKQSLTLSQLQQSIAQHFPGLTEEERLKKTNRLLGLLTPPPSTVNNTFWQSSPTNQKQAFDEFHHLQVANHYIQQAAIEKNIRWKTTIQEFPIEITINLSKPEKNNADTAKLLLTPAKNQKEYPACLICKTNLGFQGTITKASRENMRHLSFSLGNKPWFLQFSPYAYYPYHCIVIDEIHTPMHLDAPTYEKLYDFVDLFPYLFIGSNSDLPIVGGSILNHAHFQGGQYKMPMMVVPTRHHQSIRGFAGTLHELSWLNNAFRYDSKTKADALAFICRVDEIWKTYRNESLEIIPFTSAQHSGLTVVVEKTSDLYQTYFILRNNRSNPTYPSGIFHAHPQHHHIKQESIGLIEAMGLFILPGRLKQALHDIEHLDDQAPIPESLTRYLSMIERLRREKPLNRQQALVDMINQTCFAILQNTAVFKKTTEGQRGLTEWIHGLHR